MKNLVNYTLIVVAVLILGTAIYYGNRNFIPYQTQLEIANDRLMKHSPDIYNKVRELNTETNFTIKNGDLSGDVLAQTRITETGSEIIVDVRKVKLKRDRLEPVIGHEIYHIWEAYNNS